MLLTAHVMGDSFPHDGNDVDGGHEVNSGFLTIGCLFALSTDFLLFKDFYYYYYYFQNSFTCSNVIAFLHIFECGLLLYIFYSMILMKEVEKHNSKCLQWLYMYNYIYNCILFFCKM